MEKHPLQIKTPELQKSKDVQTSVGKKERLTREKIPNDPNERIEVYMDRLENIFLNPNQRMRERNLEMMRNKIYDALIIKRENVPESFFELQKRVARERGQTIEEIPQDMRERMIDTIIEDQKYSLDQWINYLTSSDAVYPAWFKYFVWTQIIKLSQFDKTLGKFKDRTSTTTAPFPDIYREPLAQICDLYEKVKKDNKSLKDEEIREIFSKKFSAAYAELITQSLATKIESNEEIKGEWVKYEQGNTENAEKLFESLQGKGTGWCTAGKSTAKIQIESGDFYVYYTYDANNEPTQPRVAIRMEGADKIGEVRGILEHQAMEPQMMSVLEEKLKDFGPEAHKYNKKVEDMRKMTEIERKTEAGQELSKEELIFLYEINNQIEGFGYKKDPRIQEIRDKRNPKEDAPIVLDCKPEEIATNENEINGNTRAYIGPLFPGIFQSSINSDNIFTSFPDGKIQKYEVSIGGKTKDELIQEMQNKNVYISSWANDLLQSPDFKTSESKEDINLVRLTVKDLGFSRTTTTDEIYQRAEELGLDLCSAEVGPHLRLSYFGQDWMYIAMKQISDRDSSPDVFNLYWDGVRPALDADGARPGRRWDPDYKFVFSLRKS